MTVRRPSFSASSALCLLLLAPPAASAQVLNEFQIFEPESGLFARNLDLEGNVLAATVLQPVASGLTESLSIFEPDAFGLWQRTALEVPAAYVVGDQFGEGVSVSGSRVAVSAFNHDAGGMTESGAVWIYERDPAGVWLETATVSPEIAFGRFGNDEIGLDGDVLAAMGRVGPNLSSLYIHERDAGGTWIETFISPAEPSAQYLSLEGETVALGMPAADGGDGRVRLYVKIDGAWTLHQTLTPGLRTERWGVSVDLDGDLLAFGAYAFEKGEVRVFERQASGHYTEIAVIPVPTVANREPMDISIAGDRLVISAPRDDTFGPNFGAVYVHRRDLGGTGAWGRDVTLLPLNPATGLGFEASASGSLVAAELGDSTLGLFDLEGSVVEIDLAGPVCSPTSSVDLLATLSAADDVDLTYRVGDGPETAVCSACAETVPFTAAPLAACSNTVTATATDALGATAFATRDVIFDDQPPVLDPIYCSDRMVLIPNGYSQVFVPRPNALDDCDNGITPTCTAGPNFPLGTTAASCSRADACGNVGSCDFNVEVVAEDTVPFAGCFDDDFNDASVDPRWTLIGVGNANQHSAAEGAGVLELTADGATAFYGADNAGFLYQEITGYFRAEVTIDGSTMTSGGQYRKAGLMVRQSFDPLDVRVLAQLVPFWENGDETHLQFVAREGYGLPGRIPVARDVVGVPRTVRLAIERINRTIFVEYSIDDGATWIRPSTGLGGQITFDELAPTLLVGLNMVSNNISVTSTARFDDATFCFEAPGE